MLDWANPKAYAFTKHLDRNGWAWAFMRRNPVYRTEFAALPTAESNYNPRKKKRETERAWVLRVRTSGGEPRRMTPYERFAKKWRVMQIRTPDSDKPPDFDVHPVWPSFDAIKQYFDEDEPYAQKQRFAVAVFDLRSLVPTQLERAKAHLLARQKTVRVKKSPRRRWPIQWTIYLRIIDADLAGAKSKEIRAKLKEYFPESEDADHKHKAADKFADHRKAAFALRDDPLSILLQTSP
jgi:hypothetical protein